MLQRKIHHRLTSNSVSRSFLISFSLKSASTGVSELMSMLMIHLEFEKYGIVKLKEAQLKVFAVLKAAFFANSLRSCFF